MRTLDIVIIAAYLIGMVAAGIACRGRQEDADQYFTSKGGFRGKIGVLLVGLSITATLFSGLSFVIYTSTAYAHGAKIVVGALGIPIAWLILRFWFLPRYLKPGLDHPYDIIELRFGQGPRLCVSAMFILLRIGWMGAMLGAPTLVLMGAAQLSSEWFWPIVLVTGLSCTLYTAIGGIRGVIVTDAIQFFIIIVGLLFIVGFILARIDLPVATIFNELQDAGRLEILDFNFSLTETYTFWGVLLGLTISGLGSYLADLMMLQRYLAAESPKAAAQSFLVNVWGAILIIISLVTVGLLLWTWYRFHPDPGIPAKSDEVLAYFIAKELPSGMAGLLIAAIMAATMSSMTSGIIALAGTITHDWLERFGRARTSGELFHVGRLISLSIGVAATIAGGFTTQLGPLFQVSQTMMSVFLGPMLGCMVLAVSAARVRPVGALIGMALGALAGGVVILSPVSFIWVAPVSSLVTILSAHLFRRSCSKSERFIRGSSLHPD